MRGLAVHHDVGRVVVEDGRDVVLRRCGLGLGLVGLRLGNHVRFWVVVRLGVAVGRGRGYGEGASQWRVRKRATVRVRGKGGARVKADARGFLHKTTLRYAHSTSGNALVVYEMSRQVLPTAPSPTITHFTFCIIDIVQGEADTRGLPRCRTTPVSCAEREPGSVVPPVPPRAAGQAATVAPWRAP